MDIRQRGKKTFIIIAQSLSMPRHCAFRYSRKIIKGHPPADCIVMIACYAHYKGVANHPNRRYRLRSVAYYIAKTQKGIGLKQLCLSQYSAQSDDVCVDIREYRVSHS